MNKLLKILFDQFGGTLSITRKSSGTIITAAAFNTNYDEIEAVVNGAIEAANIAADAVTKSELNVDCIRADYGLVQHTDGALYVDVSDTNPSLEITDGGLRAKVYGLINRTGDGLTFGRSGDMLLSSSGTTPDGWTDVSATYADKFIRVSATALTASGTDTHDHGAATSSHTLTTAQIPAHTHTVTAYQVSGTAGSNWGHTETSTNGATLTTDSGGGTGGGHTHVISSADNIPAYITLKMYQKT